LAKVPINTGISTVTMKVLKNNVAKLPPAGPAKAMGDLGDCPGRQHGRGAKLKIIFI